MTRLWPVLCKRRRGTGRNFRMAERGKRGGGKQIGVFPASNGTRRADSGVLTIETAPSTVAASWTEYAEKLAFRADSILVQLSDEAFETGMTALRDHARSASPEEPVVEPVDFFVFC
jgi:hypothetical protein